jgi:hypothetical protein
MVNGNILRNVQHNNTITTDNAIQSRLLFLASL